jgi:predicted AAA+ superfamily ATPase
LLHLISNTAKPYTYNKLKNTYGVGSANSISDYVQWFEDSYLIFSVPQFSWSAKSSSVNPKKVYAIDTGFAKANSLSFSNDDGRLLENAVFLALRRSTPEIFYFKQRGECDFVVRDRNQIVRAVQACYSVDANNQAREVGGLREAMNFFNLDRGELVTLDQEDTLVDKGKQIDLVPAWKWMR